MALVAREVTGLEVLDWEGESAEETLFRDR